MHDQKSTNIGNRTRGLPSCSISWHACLKSPSTSFGSNLITRKYINPMLYFPNKQDFSIMNCSSNPCNCREKKLLHVGFEVFTTGTMKNAVFCGVTTRVSCKN
jgi:hypothetical protein